MRNGPSGLELNPRQMLGANNRKLPGDGRMKKEKGKEQRGGHIQKPTHGGLIFEPSAWAQKINERAPVGNMPLMSEFASCKGWETAAKRWKNLLYNRPVSSAIEYFINNLKNSERSILDRGDGDFIKCHFRKKWAKTITY